MHYKPNRKKTLPARNDQCIEWV